MTYRSKRHCAGQSIGPGPITDDSGYALVSAVWFVGFLAGAALLLATTTRHTLQSTGFTVERAQAMALADGLVELVGLALASRDVAAPANHTIPRNGDPVGCTLPDGSTAHIVIQDQSGLLNVNLAAQDTLEQFFKQVLPGYSRTSQLAADIVRFRTSATLQGRGSGGSSSWVPSAGNGFRTLDELDLVDGVTPGIRDQISKFLTVHGRSTTIDISLAPAAFRAVAEKIAPGTGAAASDITAIDVVVKTRTGIIAGRSAVIDPLPHPRRPFRILAWSVPAASVHAMAGAPDIPASDCETVLTAN